VDFYWPNQINIACFELLTNTSTESPFTEISLIKPSFKIKDYVNTLRAIAAIASDYSSTALSTLYLFLRAFWPHIWN